MTFAEVKSHLAESAKDLGDLGFDNEFGYGLLDVNKLLETWNAPIIEITYPLDNEGLASNFDIIGSVNAEDFSRYSVMYTTENNPEISDWYDINYPHNNAPLYIYETVEEGVLGQFNINGLRPEDRYYQIRLELITNEGYRYCSYKDVVIDLSSPVFNDSLSTFSLRYAYDTPNLFLSYQYDEPVNLEVQWPAGETISNDAAMVSSGSINLDQHYYPDSLLLIATNRVGLSTHTYFPAPEEVEFNSIQTSGFEQRVLDTETIWAYGNMDVNNNGFIDLFGMVDPAGEQISCIYEFNGSTIDSLYQFPFKIWPLSLGKTDYTGAEILGLDFDNAYLYDSYGIDFPNYVMWIEPDVFGGNFIDYDDDDYHEVALVKNKTIDFSTKRVISLFNREELDFFEEYTLINNSDTETRNEFSNRICSGDFDSDGLKEILTADKDGDIIIYEFSPEENLFIESWTFRLAVQNAFYLETGDFNGDEQTDFCVGGYRQDYAHINNNYSSFTFFTNNGEDNQYNTVSTLHFSEVEQKNALNTFDLDGNGDMEFVIAVPPNLYIIDYLDDKMSIIWVGKSNLDYQNTLAAVSQHDTQSGYIIANANIDGLLQSTVVTKQEQLPIDPPAGFVVSPLDETTLQLSWDVVSNASSYNVYRRTDNSIELTAQSYSTSYLDTNLTPGDTVFYQITSIEENSGLESYPNAWKSAVPFYCPELIEARIINSNLLILAYSYPLASNTIKTENFLLTSYGNPSSAISRNQNKGLTLTYSDVFNEGESYALVISNLSGSTGVPVCEELITIESSFDYECPFIDEVIIATNHKSAEFIFSEDMQISNILDLDNYLLETPIVDPDNRIIDVSYINNNNSFTVRLAFATALKPSNEGYYLHLENLVDLAGNPMHLADKVHHFNLTDIDDLEHLIVYPNPLVYSKIAVEEECSFRFLNLPRKQRGKICDLRTILVLIITCWIIIVGTQKIIITEGYRRECTSL